MQDYLLSLDIASTTGFALGIPGGAPKLWAVKLGDKGATPEERGWKLMNTLGELFEVTRPRWLVYEAPLPRGGAQSTAQTAFMLSGLAFTAASVARGWGVPNIQSGHAGSVRKVFLGRGNLPSAQAKRLALARCAGLGWDAKGSADAADAGALWYWRANQLDPVACPPLPPMPEAQRAAA